MKIYPYSREDIQSEEDLVLKSHPGEFNRALIPEENREEKDGMEKTEEPELE